MDDVPVTPDLVIPAGELRERFSRSSGPGGQSVNTADSRVELSFDLARSPSLPPGLRDRALSRLTAAKSSEIFAVTGMRGPPACRKTHICGQSRRMLSG